MKIIGIDQFMLFAKQHKLSFQIKKYIYTHATFHWQGFNRNQCVFFAVHRGRMMPILTELVNSKNGGESQLFIKYEQM